MNRKRAYTKCNTCMHVYRYKHMTILREIIITQSDCDKNCKITKKDEKEEPAKLISIDQNSTYLRYDYYILYHFLHYYIHLPPYEIVFTDK